MDFTKTKHKVLKIERKDNKYNKSLKWILTTILVGINEEEDKKLIPYKDRQIIKEWYKTEKEAKKEKDFYNTYYQNDWGNGSWKKI